MIKQKDSVNATVLIAFLKRLIAGAKHEIFLIAGRGPVRIAKKTRIFGESRVLRDGAFGASLQSPASIAFAFGTASLATEPRASFRSA